MQLKMLLTMILHGLSFDSVCERVYLTVAVNSTLMSRSRSMIGKWSIDDTFYAERAATCTYPFYNSLFLSSFYAH